MDEMMAAIQEGDYARAYEALQRTPEAGTQIGAACGAFLLALIERFDEADRLVRAANLQGFEVIVNGERERAARWRDPAAQGGFASVAQTAMAPGYAAIAAAFASRDEALAERTMAERARLARPLAGRITFVDGTVRPFADLADADDAIGHMLEAYCGQGLLYFPFEVMRRLDVLPKTNFMDLLIPKVKITAHQGTARAYVPLLYAGSTVSSSAGDRNGRMTRFDYLGSARRGFGQRDFRVDSALVGFERVAAIEF